MWWPNYALNMPLHVWFLFLNSSCGRSWFRPWYCRGRECNPLARHRPVLDCPQLLIGETKTKHKRYVNIACSLTVSLNLNSSHHLKLPNKCTKYTCNAPILHGEILLGGIMQVLSKFKSGGGGILLGVVVLYITEVFKLGHCDIPAG